MVCPLQKFRFCGEGDCPDWVLAEIISTLSNLSIENLEQLSDLVAQRICGETFEVCNYLFEIHKYTRLYFQEAKIKSLTSTLTNEGNRRGMHQFYADQRSSL